MLCNTCTECRFIKEKLGQKNGPEGLGLDSTALETITHATQEWSVFSLPQKEPGPRESSAEHLHSLRYVQADLSPKLISQVIIDVTEVSGVG